MSKPLVAWSYAVELLASSLILVLLCLWLGSAAVATFVRTAAMDIATIFSTVMFGGSLAFLWTLFSKAETPFFRWLEQKGALCVYVSATIYTVAVSFLSAATLVLAKYVDAEPIGLIAMFLLLMAVLNLYTLVVNVSGIMKLNAKFEQLRRDA